MVLEKYSKADLKSIVQIYNLGLDESEIKKKKAELIKAMKGVKKSFDEKDIEKKLTKHKGKKDKDDDKQPKITDKFHVMPDGSVHTGAKHTKNSKLVDPARKKIIQKYHKLIEKETDKGKKKELSIERNKELAQLKK